MSDVIKAPIPGEVIVRMYRQGLGDCFLLTFRGQAGKPFHVLIDCGVWDADAETVKRMDKVVKNIAASTGSHLDLLVVTHEHWDHVSGFLQGAADFKKMTIDHVWLAWTEDPGDAVARKLKREYAATRAKLKLAIDRLRSANPALAGELADLLVLGAGVRADPAQAMSWVRGLHKQDARVRFCKPREVLDLPGSSDARVYVLGPPRDPSDLRKNLPTERQKAEGETYLRTTSRADAAFFAAALHGLKSRQELGPAERHSRTASLPFDATHQIQPADARSMPFFQQYYGVDEKHAGSWRRIDDDWLNVAAELALWMDSSTNNTSLALAIELKASGKVLLFVGDAQVGSWMSWNSLVFNVPELGADVTTPGLLARTVLYKVGHHGSHNATLRKNGLERMTSDELVAMIPVNRASVEKKGWKMPFAPMYAGLRTATKGRIIRSDEGVVTNPAGLSKTDWQAFVRRVVTTPEYVEYRLR